MNEDIPQLDLPNAYRATALHAGFWYRAAAMLIDIIILSSALYALDFLLTSTLHLPVSGGVLTLISYPLWWLYFSVFESSRLQASPGKWVFGLRVVGEHGVRIGFVRASVRVWMMLLPLLLATAINDIFAGNSFVNPVLLILLIAWLAIPGMTRRKQALHDWIANTFVVLEPGLHAYFDGDKQAMQLARPRLPRWVAVVPVVALCAGLPAWGGYWVYDFLKVHEQAQLAEFEARSFVDMAKIPIAEYSTGKNTPAPNNAAVGLPAPNAMHGFYVTSVEVKNGAIMVTLGGQAASKLQGKHLTYEQAIGPRGETQWRCASSNMARDLLPVGCL